MIPRLVICTVFSFCGAVLIHCYGGTHAEILSFYGSQLRGSLFSGLLAVGGFLLSLETVIIIKLKESVYDHEKYDKKLETMKQFDESIDRYQPLKRLSDFLSTCVLVTILAAVAQLTLGITNNYWLCLAAIGCAIFALAVLLCALLLIKRSLDDLFEFISEASE